LRRMDARLLPKIINILGHTLHLTILLIHLGLDLSHQGLRVSDDFYVALDVYKLVAKFCNLPSQVLLSLASQTREGGARLVCRLYLCELLLDIIASSFQVLVHHGRLLGDPLMKLH
jgi:hypothetical protein